MDGMLVFILVVSLGTFIAYCIHFVRKNGWNPGEGYGGGIYIGRSNSHHHHK